MEQAFSNRGSKCVRVESGSSLSIDNLAAINLQGGKINIKNDTDGLDYTLCVQSVAGQAVFYLFRGGNARVVSGIYQILNDTDGLWYPLGVENKMGQAVPYLGPGVPT